MYREVHPHLLNLPAEVRLGIYSFVLEDWGEIWLPIRNKPAGRQNKLHDPSSSATTRSKHRRSTKYKVMEQTSMFHSRCDETTYSIGASRAELHTSLMAVCRLLYNEASEVLYGRHFFDFGCHIEAVVPFLQDRTQKTRGMVRFISVYKQGLMPCLGGTSRRYEWSHMFRYLATSGAVTKLRIVMECGKPKRPWEGVQDLSESDVRLLSLIGHESLEWVGDLAKVKTLRELDIVPDIRYLPDPSSQSMAVYAALSASIETGLMSFLRAEMLGSR